MNRQFERCALSYNPFEPAASGAPLGSGPLWLPENRRASLTSAIERLSTGRGPKVLPIYGTYGTGKTYTLEWLRLEELPVRRIHPYYFTNPGVQFYDLVNKFLTQLGRKEFSKYVWELVQNHVEAPRQLDLYSGVGYEQYIQQMSHGKRSLDRVTRHLQEAIQKAGITSDDQIAYRFGQIVAETPYKPFFEYRDFVAGAKGAVVAEREEAPYFLALLRALRLGAGFSAVAFLIDEFEEISIQPRLSRREAQDYLATLKRFVNLSLEDDLWIILAMTEQGMETTKQLEPALWERIAESAIQLTPLTESEARDLLEKRLSAARKDTRSKQAQRGLYPFPSDVISMLSPATTSVPRSLVKLAYRALAGMTDSTTLPFTKEYLAETEKLSSGSGKDV